MLFDGSANGFSAFQLPNRLHWILRLKHRIAGHQHICTRFKQSLGVVRVDAAVHFDECGSVLFIDHQTQLADFFVCALDELLSAEARVDRHEEHHVQVAEDVLQYADRGMGVEHHTGVDAEGLDLLHCTVDMGAGFIVEGDDVGAGLGEGLEVLLRLHDHQVDVEGLLGFLLDGLHHWDAEGDVRHEAAVHHVAVEPVGLAAVDHLDVSFQVEEVG